MCFADDVHRTNIEYTSGNAFRKQLQVKHLQKSQVLQVTENYPRQIGKLAIGEKLYLQGVNEYESGIRLQCTYCNKTFMTRSGLGEHIKKHEGVFRYRCSICHKGFQMIDHFQGHMNTHNDYRPFRCQFCEKSFSYRRSLLRHQSVCASKINRK